MVSLTFGSDELRQITIGLPTICSVKLDLVTLRRRLVTLGSFELQNTEGLVVVTQVTLRLLVLCQV